MTGVVFSNIMLAALPEALDNKIIYISPNAAPSSMAGKDCNPLFFAVSWPNDAYHEAAGQYANTRDLKSVYLRGAELPGRQGFAGRLQAHLQGPGRSARTTPSSASSTTPPSWPRSAPPSRRRCTSSCPAAWASTSSSSTSAPASARTSTLLLPGFSRRPGRHQPGRRGDGRASSTPRTGRPTSANAGEPEVRGRVREGIQARADALRLAGLRRGAADRRRGARRQGQARGPRGACGRR